MSALVAYDQTSQWVAQSTESLFKLANLPEVAKRVRPSSRRPGVELMISSKAHERQGEPMTNFKSLLPRPLSDLEQQALKDPYVFDFLTLDKPFRERELEAALIAHLERFMLELAMTTKHRSFRWWKSRSR